MLKCDFFITITFSRIDVRETAGIICERNVNAVLVEYNNLINICPGNGHSFDDTLLIMPHNLGPIIKYKKKTLLIDNPHTSCAIFAVRNARDFDL